MTFRILIAAVAALTFSALTFSALAMADPVEARAGLLKLPHADIERLVGSWQVREMLPIKMVYQFEADTMAMHGLNSQGGTAFDMTMDADYRSAGENAIFVIGIHSRPMPEGLDPIGANNPSIIGIEFTKTDEATLTVSAGERFTLVKLY